MPITIDFDQVNDAEDYSPLPDGQYLCELVEVEEATTRDGNEWWKLRFEVLKGEYQGRRIFDSLFFSDKALKRVKLILNRLGLDVSGRLKLTPELLQGRKVYIEVETEDYEDQEGKTRKRNKVPFAGYAGTGERKPAGKNTGKGKPKPRKQQEEPTEDDSEENIPF